MEIFKVPVSFRAQQSLWIWSVHKCCSELRNSFLFSFAFWVLLYFNSSYLHSSLITKFPSFRRLTCYVNYILHVRVRVRVRVCVCVCVLVAQSCLTLCDSTDCSSPGFSVRGILQARIVEWVAIPFSRDISHTYCPLTLHEPYFASIIF